MEDTAVAVEVLTDAVAEWGLVRPQVIDLLEEYQLDPDHALALFIQIVNASPGLKHQWSRHALQAAERLTIMHGLPVELIAEITGRPVADIASMGRRRNRSPRAREVLQLHNEGYTPLEIALQLKVSRTLVYQWLEEAGFTPNRRNKAYPQGARQRAVVLYRDGKTYSEIGRDLKVPTKAVPNLLRAAHRNGELPEYGSKWAGNPVPQQEGT